MSGAIRDLKNNLWKLAGNPVIAEVCIDIAPENDEWYEGIGGKPGKQYSLTGGNYRIFYVDGATKFNHFLTYWNQSTPGVTGKRGICAIEVEGVPAELPNFIGSEVPPRWTYEEAIAAGAGLYLDTFLPAGNVTYGYRYNYDSAPPGEGNIRYAFVKL
jgi:hypothetical protein